MRSERWHARCPVAASCPQRHPSGAGNSAHVSLGQEAKVKLEETRHASVAEPRGAVVRSFALSGSLRSWRCSAHRLLRPPSHGTEDPSNWPQYHRTGNGWRLGPLDQINTKNVQKLSVAWIHQPGDITQGLQARQSPSTASSITSVRTIACLRSMVQRAAKYGNTSRSLTLRQRPREAPAYYLDPWHLP
jgi:hypothetical protein